MRAEMHVLYKEKFPQGKEKTIYKLFKEKNPEISQ